MSIQTSQGELTDDAIRQYFAANPDPTTVQARAAELGMSPEQLAQAYQIAGVANPFQQNASPLNMGSTPTMVRGVATGNTIAPSTATGTAAEALAMQNTTLDPNQVNYGAIAQANPGGLWANNMYITPDQLKSFYRDGGNDNQWFQQHGITDLAQIHQLSNQARTIAGVPAESMGGAKGFEQYWNEYKQYNPSGKYVNSLKEFIGSLDPVTQTSIAAGTYTGTPQATGDFDFGGIYGPGSSFYGQDGYGSGLGPRNMGALGGEWLPQGSTATQQATGRFNTNTSIPTNYSQFNATFPNGGVMPNGAAISTPGSSSANANANTNGALTMTAGGNGMYAPGTNSIYQPGQTATNGGALGQGMNWGTHPSQQFNTPVLDALYSTQQQRMTTPAPVFDFQDKPAEPQGALTQAIAGV